MPSPFLLFTDPFSLDLRQKKKEPSDLSRKGNSNVIACGLIIRVLIIDRFTVYERDYTDLSSLLSPECCREIKARREI